MLTRLWLLFRMVIQRLNRLIWLRRSVRLTRLTEKQLKSLWKQDQLSAESEMATMTQVHLMILEAAKAPLNLSANKETEQMMEDLQTASMQLTSMLTSSKC